MYVFTSFDYETEICFHVQKEKPFLLTINKIFPKASIDIMIHKKLALNAFIREKTTCFVSSSGR